MSRVALITRETAPLLVADRFEGGDPGSLVSSLAQVPELLEAISPFLRAIYGPSGIPAREKEIVVLRVSALMGCRFCVQTHTVVARSAGLSRDEVVAVRSDESTARVAARFESARERLLVRWADLIAAGAAEPDEQLMTEVRAAFADHEIVEITMVGGATLMLNRYCTILELPASQQTRAALVEEDLQ